MRYETMKNAVTLALAGRSTDFSRCVTRFRWSSSGQDKSIYGSEFTGRLDFNQYTREISVSDVLLEVQSPIRYRDKRMISSGALNSKTVFFFTSSLAGRSTDFSLCMPITHNG